MYEKTFVLNNQSVWIEVYGDLLLRSSDTGELIVETSNERDLRVEEVNERFEIQCAADCRIAIPDSAREVVIRHARRDVEVLQLPMPLRVEQVIGDFTMAGGNKVTIGAIGGDCQLQNISQLSISSVGGDCHLRTIEGDTVCDRVGGDLLAIDITGGLKAAAGGDVLARCCEIPDKPVQLQAGGDIRLQLPDADGAVLTATSGAQSVRIDWAGEQQEQELPVIEAVLGEGQRLVQLTAGGDISLSDSAPAGDQEIGQRRQSRWMDKFQRKSQKAVRKAEVQLQKINRRVERESLRHQESMRRAESKLQQAVERAEARGVPPSSSRTAAAQPTAEEKLLVLQMLKDGKINVEEADRLLQALTASND